MAHIATDEFVGLAVDTAFRAASLDLPIASPLTYKTAGPKPHPMIQNWTSLHATSSLEPATREHLANTLHAAQVGINNATISLNYGYEILTGKRLERAASLHVAPADRDPTVPWLPLQLVKNIGALGVRELTIITPNELKA